MTAHPPWTDLLAAAAVVQVHGPPWSRDRIAATLRAIAADMKPPDDEEDETDG